MATLKSIKHICDRCGESIESPTGVDEAIWYPQEWQHIRLGQTGAELDLCTDCNVELLTFMTAKGAINMGDAIFNERRLI